MAVEIMDRPPIEGADGKMRAMNAREIQAFRRSTQRKYHIPGHSNIHTQKSGAIFLSAANNWPHELKKCEVCYAIKKAGHWFITEVETNKATEMPNGEKKKRKVDVVDLDSGMEIEVVDSSLTEITQKAMENQDNIIIVRVDGREKP